MSNTKISALPAAVGIDATNDVLPIVQTGTTNKISRNTLMGVTGTPADLSTVQTFTNKVIGNTNSATLKDGSFTLQNTSDTTKQGVFSLASVTTSTTRTYTLPNASVTLASLTGTETFTNKTITSPSITGGTIDNSTITVDSISGHSVAANVTVGGVALNNGVISTASSVTSTAIAIGAVQPKALVSGSGTSWAWQSFTGSIGWTNLSVGNGTNQAQFTQIGKMIYYLVTVVFGSTTSISGSVTFVPPIAASTLYTTIAQNVVCGNGHMTVNSGGTKAITAPFFNGTNAAITIGYFVSGTGLAAINATAPATWTTGDLLEFSGWYQAS